MKEQSCQTPRSSLGSASVLRQGSRAFWLVSLAQGGEPTCFVCQEPKPQSDLFPSPLSGDSTVWCSPCLEEWTEAMDERRRIWEERDDGGY